MYVTDYEFYGNANLVIDLKRLTYKTTIKVVGEGGSTLENAKVVINETHNYTQRILRVLFLIFRMVAIM